MNLISSLTSKFSALTTASATAQESDSFLLNHVEDWREQFRGEIIAQSQKARYNEMCKEVFVKKTPFNDVGPSDVVECINFAKKHRLGVTVRGGGHSVAGNFVEDDYLMIDLSLMRTVYIDGTNKIAYVDGGALWYDVDREAQMYGLATTAGLVSHTGVGGLTLGGGVGWLSRRCGLACDNLLSADVVTANGELLVASPDSNPDLFWAIRGGGGNFGVVTNFRFKLTPVKDCIFAQQIFPHEVAKEVVATYAEFTKTLPPNVTTFLWLAEPGVVLMSIFFDMDEMATTEVMQPFKKFTQTFAAFYHKPYAEVNSMFDSGNNPGYYSWSKSRFFNEISPELIDKLVDSYQACEFKKQTTIEIMLLGGKTAEVPSTETPFYHRNAKYEIHTICRYHLPADGKNIPEFREITRKFTDAFEPYSMGGGYVNINTEGTNPQNQYGENLERLQQIKLKYDPTNFFHKNHNIVPPKPETSNSNSNN